MELKKEQGGVSIGEFTWAKDGDVVEVPDELGAELLAIKGGDYSRVDPAPAPPEKPAAPAAKAPAAAAAPAEPAK